MYRVMLRLLLLVIVGLAAACATTKVAAQRPAENQHEEPPTDPWFMAQRLSVDHLLPPDVRRRAVEEARRLDKSDGPTGSWVNVGPSNIGGRVSSLAIGSDMTGQELLWLGSAAGGVFSSTDGGSTWTPRFDSQTALSIGAIAVDPLDKRIVYVGTGEDDNTSASYDGEGLFRSTDAGATWTPRGLELSRRIARIAIDPTNTQRLFVAADGAIYTKDTNRGLYRSTDGGASWTKVLGTDNDTGCVDVAIDPSNPQRVFAALWQRSRADNNTYWGGTRSGLYRSLDGGTTWNRVGNGFPTGSLGRIGVAIAASNPATVYAAVRETSGSFKGVYKSTNSGNSWTKVDVGNLNLFLASYGWWFGPIRVDPTNENTVYLLDVSLYRSTDGGRNWNSIGSELHADQHEVLIEPPGRLLVGNDGGFYQSTNNGSTFQRFTSLPTSQFYDICTDPQRPQRRFGGLQDNGTVRTQTGATNDWTNVLGGDGMECDIDLFDSNRMYAESQNGGIARSFNGGNSFTGATNGIDGSERKNWVTPLRVDPLTPNTVYTGAQKVYRSTDNAGFWTAISPDLTVSTLPSGGNPIAGTISALGVSPVDNRVIWAGTDNGNVYVTDNGGLTWTKVNPSTNTHWVTEIAPDPFDARTAYLTISGYKLGSKLPYLRVTRDLGATWQDLATNLPTAPLNSVIPDPLDEQRLFVASDIGVHVSSDGGVNWSLLGSGMPAIVVHDLALNTNSWTLFAGTHSRSVYGYDLRQLPQRDWDGDGVGNLDDCARRDATTYQNAPEVNDGRDNQCPGDRDFGIVDEISGDCGFHNLLEPGRLSWPAQSGATGYEVARSSNATFSSGCTLFATTTASLLDQTTPTPNAALFYLVRPSAPHAGSWGRRSNGTERSLAGCP